MDTTIYDAQFYYLKIFKIYYIYGGLRKVKQTFVNHHSKPKILIENKSPIDLTMKKDDLKFSLVRVVNQPYKLEKSLKKVDEVIPMANSNVGQIDPHSTKNGEHSRQRPAKPGPFP